MTTIYLIRHGEITQERPRRFVGQKDLPLTEQGLEQASSLADFLAAQAIDRVACSPLSRCRETARIIGQRLGVVPQIFPDLREIALGAWEGLSVAEVKVRFPGCYEARGTNLAGFRPMGGESFVDLHRRVWPVFESIALGGEERMAIIAHAGVNRVILCRILRIAFKNLLGLDQDYGCLNTIHHDGKGYSVTAVNSYLANGELLPGTRGQE
ncbi:MAG: histidine phosphatase family protein [Desulforhopalus sp.]|nr:histidine phosphatase family protein [Desulforhopalus sp.]